jgi:hypothetical protein
MIFFANGVAIMVSTNGWTETWTHPTPIERTYSNEALNPQTQARPHHRVIRVETPFVERYLSEVWEAALIQTPTVVSGSLLDDSYYAVAENLTVRQQEEIADLRALTFELHLDPYPIGS